MHLAAQASKLDHQFIKKQFDDYRHRSGSQKSYPNNLKQQAVALLQNGCSLEQAICICGVSKITLCKWRDAKNLAILPPRCLDVVSQKPTSLELPPSICRVKFAGGTEISIPVGSIFREIILAFKEVMA